MTLEDFYVEVLQKLGTLAAEETPTAADRLAVKDKYEQINAEMQRREVIDWFDDEDVPDWASDSMATIVAGRLTGKFSIPMERRAELMAMARDAETEVISDGQRRESPRVPATSSGRRARYY